MSFTDQDLGKYYRVKDGIAVVHGGLVGPMKEIMCLVYFRKANHEDGLFKLGGGEEIRLKFDEVEEVDMNKLYTGEIQTGPEQEESLTLAGQSAFEVFKGMVTGLTFPEDERKYHKVVEKIANQAIVATDIFFDR